MISRPHADAWIDRVGIHVGDRMHAEPLCFMIYKSLHLSSRSFLTTELTTLTKPSLVAAEQMHIATSGLWLDRGVWGGIRRHQI